MGRFRIETLTSVGKLRPQGLRRYRMFRPGATQGVWEPCVAGSERSSQAPYPFTVLGVLSRGAGAFASRCLLARPCRGGCFSTYPPTMINRFVF